VATVPRSTSPRLSLKDRVGENIEIQLPFMIFVTS
jgi:hypothetical protein